MSLLLWHICLSATRCGDIRSYVRVSVYTGIEGSLHIVEHILGRVCTVDVAAAGWVDDEPSPPPAPPADALDTAPDERDAINAPVAVAMGVCVVHIDDVVGICVIVCIYVGKVCDTIEEVHGLESTGRPRGREGGWNITDASGLLYVVCSTALAGSLLDLVG